MPRLTAKQVKKLYGSKLKGISDEVIDEFLDKLEIIALDFISSSSKS